MYQFYLTISIINEKVNTIFISPETSTSYFDVALNKRDADQGSVFYVWSFSCNALRKPTRVKNNKRKKYFSRTNENISRRNEKYSRNNEKFSRTNEKNSRRETFS